MAPRPTGHSTRLIAAAIAIGAAFAHGATAASSEASEPPAAPAPQFEPCELHGSGGQGRVDAQCGTFTVAVDPERPDGPTIDLYVARIAALTPEPRDDAITLINGGPGASSVTMYADFQPAFEALRRERDIIVVDQRGTGRSAPLDCPSLEEASQAFDAALIERTTTQCLTTAANDPRFFTTSVAVRDLEALRKALGYRQWNLYGVSYGTRVAQHYLQRYPQAVRTLIIDGVVPLDLALGPDIALNAQQSLDAILARCGGTPYCVDAFPNPTGQLAALSQRLRAAPIDLIVPHPLTGRSKALTLHYAHLAMTLRLLSYAPETAALIPLIVDQAERQDNFTPLAAQALRIEQELGEAISFGMHNSVVCTEDVPFYSDLPRQMAALEASYLGADQVRALQTICKVWPAGTIDPHFRAPSPSPAPVLLLSGEFDPITPPRYAEQAAKLYPNGLNLLAPGQGHGVIARGCVLELVSDFIDDAGPESLDTGCLERLGADPFFVDLLGPPP